MKKFAGWLKKNLFYVILFLVVAIALEGYNLWFRQSMDLIPEGAQDVRINTTLYSFNNGPVMEVHVIYEKYNDDFTTENHAVILTEEGCRKLLDALSGQKMRAVTSAPGGQLRDKGGFRFGLVYSMDGINYTKFIYCWNSIQVTNNWVAYEEGAKPAFDPSRRFPTIITGPEEADALYYTVIDIITNYAASDTIVN